MCWQKFRERGRERERGWGRKRKRELSEIPSSAMIDTILLVTLINMVVVLPSFPYSAPLPPHNARTQLLVPWAQGPWCR